MRRKVFDPSPEERKIISRRLAGRLSEHAEVMFAYIYGSFAEELPFHDIDVGVHLSEAKEQEFMGDALALGQDLSSLLKMPVDVRVLNFAPVSFLYHVIRGTLILERNEEIRSRIVERTIQKYLDLKPITRRTIKEAFGT